MTVTETFSHPQFSAHFHWQDGLLASIEVTPPAPATPATSPWGAELARVIRSLGPHPLAWPKLPLARHRVSAFAWEVLRSLARTVPPGTTTTYGELAQHLGTSPRAIGQVMARNPWPLLFPCHRVLARKGLGGYGPGLALKAVLLRLEAAI